MRIVSLDWQSNTGSLKNVRNATRLWRTRQSLLVRIRQQDGLAGHGEASPLPGYSPDGLAEAERDLRIWSSEHLPAVLDPDLPLTPQLDTLLESLGAASARCAVETALLDLVGRSRTRPVWSLLTASRPREVPPREVPPREVPPREVPPREVPPREVPPKEVPLCGLITNHDRHQALAEVESLRARGIDTVKIKIGRPGALDYEIGLIRAIRKTGMQIRLDANGSLPAGSLPATLERLRGLDPCLIEEPAAPGTLLALADAAPTGFNPIGIPLGLDESLQGADGEHWIDRMANRGVLAAVVLKPMALGGLLRCLHLARHAARYGVGAIASHLYDGPIALAAAAHLALALPTPQAQGLLACGLDRHPGLQAWPSLPLEMVADKLLTDRAIVATDRPGLGIRSEAFP